MSTTFPPAGLGSGIAVPMPDILPPVRQRSRVGGFIWRNPTIIAGGALLAVIVFLGVFAPILGTVDPTALAPAKRLRLPSAIYWFGTDMLGRDIYSRTLYGARVSLVVGFAVAGLSSAVGMLIGMCAGYIRLVDALVMRVMDGLMSIPSILLAIALMALTRGSVQNVVIAITVAEIPRVTRLVRGVVLSLREQPYVEAAVASGTRTPAIIFRHILPNTVAPLTVQATFICASAMITEAILSFIGAGTPPIIPSWGNIMAEGRALWQIKPYIVFFPAACLARPGLAVNLRGAGLRDMRDPRLAKRIGWTTLTHPQLFSLSLRERAELAKVPRVRRTRGMPAEGGVRGQLPKNTPKSPPPCSTSSTCKPISAPPTASSAPWKTYLSSSIPARPSPSWARAAAASRSPPCRSCA